MLYPLSYGGSGANDSSSAARRVEHLRGLGAAGPRSRAIASLDR